MDTFWYAVLALARTQSLVPRSIVTTFKKTSFNEINTASQSDRGNEGRVTD
ncbi:hypothetical protein [Vibrio sp. 10N.247.311.51]|uniref:hypothetical protein n=1 Tax=Vibrio sp. 10N.247.311.51 TaxID=3229996 RepID=UPI0035530215